MLFTNTNCSVVSVQKQILEVSGNSHVPMFSQPGSRAGTLTVTCTNENTDQMLL